MKIHQGDQYLLPVAVSIGDTNVTPENVTDVRIKLGDSLKCYSEDELDHDAEAEAWVFPLTEEMTHELNPTGTLFQVEIKIGQELIMSDVQRIDIRESIIRERWT